MPWQKKEEYGNVKAERDERLGAFEAGPGSNAVARKLLPLEQSWLSRSEDRAFCGVLFPLLLRFEDCLSEHIVNHSWAMLKPKQSIGGGDGRDGNQP